MNASKFSFLDVGATYRELHEDLDAAYQRVMNSGWYLLGAELESFEVEFAEFAGVAHCAGVGSGLDALTLALRALDVGPGDEVIVPSNTYIATWLAVLAVGATVVPVEPDERTYNLTGEMISAAISPRTAAILPVHLYGQPADVDGIARVATHYGVPVLYDAAQAHGASSGGRPIGTYGDVVAWSFYPGKNLGAFGDGGAVTSQNAELVRRVRLLRNYGSEVKYFNTEVGVNSRLDELSAAFLRVKLRHLEDWNSRRRAIAKLYLKGLADLPLLLPDGGALDDHAWHVFAIQTHDRDLLQAALKDAGIPTMIHYPIPPHRQEALAHLAIDPQPIAEAMASRLLSLPMGPHLNHADALEVVRALTSLIARWTQPDNSGR